MVELHCACKGMPDSTEFYYIIDVIRMVKIIEGERQKVLSFYDSLVGLPALTLTLWRRNFLLNFSTPVYKM